jgi:hypothetical protein
MNAAEARKKTQENKKALVESKTGVIFQKINEAAGKGLSSCTYSSSRDVELEKVLQQLGYQSKFNDYYDPREPYCHSTYTISW